MVRRVGQRGLEPPYELVLSTRARLEDLEPVADALANAVVVADVEVEEREVDEAAPVPSVETVPLRDVERPGDDLVAAPRNDPREAGGESLGHELEEALVQVPPTPDELVDRSGVERM